MWHYVVIEIERQSWITTGLGEKLVNGPCWNILYKVPIEQLTVDQMEYQDQLSFNGCLSWIENNKAPGSKYAVMKIISANLGIEEEIEFLPPDKPVVRTDQKYCKRGDHMADRKEFHKSSSTVDGLASWCKHCTKQYQEEYYKTRPRKRGHFISEGIDREEVQALIKHHEERLNYLRTLI